MIPPDEGHCHTSLAVCDNLWVCLPRPFSSIYKAWRFWPRQSTLFKGHFPMKLLLCFGCGLLHFSTESFMPRVWGRVFVFAEQWVMKDTQLPGVPRCCFLSVAQRFQVHSTDKQGTLLSDCTRYLCFALECLSNSRLSGDAPTISIHYSPWYSYFSLGLVM